MTTIAYRNDTLSADSRSVRHGWIAQDFPQKIRRLKDGTVAAFTGDIGPGEEGIVWLEKGRPEPQPDFDDVTLLHMREPGVLHIYEGKGCAEFRGPYCAYGSGYPAAMVALHLGCDAERAVQLAAMVDPNTGGEITILRLVEREKAIDRVVAEKWKQQGLFQPNWFERFWTRLFG